MTILKVGQAIKDLINGINSNFDDLDKRKTYKLLWSGSQDIPSLDSGSTTTITLSDSLANYDAIVLQLDDCCAYTHFGGMAVGTVFKPVHNQMNFDTGMMGWNMFGYNCEVIANNKLKLSKFVYSGSSYDKNQYLDIYELRYLTGYSVFPITNVIGIKFN